MIVGLRMVKKAKVSVEARLALSQAHEGARIVASSKPILDDENDPPCIRAKREYECILNEVGGAFYCTGEPHEYGEVKPLEFEVSKEGVTLKKSDLSAAAIITSSPAPRAG